MRVIVGLVLGCVGFAILAGAVGIASAIIASGREQEKEK